MWHVPTVKQIVQDHAENGLNFPFRAGDIMPYEPGRSEKGRVYNGPSQVPDFYRKNQKSMFYRAKDRKAAYKTHVPTQLRRKIRRSIEKEKRTMEDVTNVVESCRCDAKFIALQNCMYDSEENVLQFLLRRPTLVPKQKKQPKVCKLCCYDLQSSQNR